MKKTLLLASLLAITLSACGKNEEEAAPATETTPPAVTTPAEPATPAPTEPATPAPTTPADPAAPAAPAQQ
ncbi:MAG: hypothetical protein QHC78_19870 [Pigmentiphaga sp.]|uniref:hypothetical protein n=1 Tax=Pigmentiphaga sp. TaxID=1977564 RepID=UPI0029B23EAA|nr:hypothetical protein [Pigmentiphaga sp.]MDX3907950.1 hypothetical protein [Pigmentiphaga sp.]